MATIMETSEPLQPSVDAERSTDEPLEALLTTSRDVCRFPFSTRITSVFAGAVLLIVGIVVFAPSDKRNGFAIMAGTKLDNHALDTTVFCKPAEPYMCGDIPGDEGDLCQVQSRSCHSAKCTWTEVCYERADWKDDWSVYMSVWWKEHEQNPSAYRKSGNKYCRPVYLCKGSDDDCTCNDGLRCVPDVTNGIDSCWGSCQAKVKPTTCDAYACPGGYNLIKLTGARTTYEPVEECCKVPKRRVEPKRENFMSIICPFLSTMINEGILPVQDSYNRDDLETLLRTTGKNTELSESDLGMVLTRNFQYFPDDFKMDIFNMEGAWNEHQTSTGITDCATTFTGCETTYGSASWCTSISEICTLPNVGMFDKFWDSLVKDPNGDSISYPGAFRDMETLYSGEHGLQIDTNQLAIDKGGGTIESAFTNLIKVFGTNHQLSESALRSLLIDRRFPSTYQRSSKANYGTQ